MGSLVFGRLPSTSIPEASTLGKSAFTTAQLVCDPRNLRGGPRKLWVTFPGNWWQMGKLMEVLWWSRSKSFSLMFVQQVKEYYILHLQYSFIPKWEFEVWKKWFPERIESSQPLGGPGDSFSRIFLILNVNYMPTNKQRKIKIYHDKPSGAPRGWDDSNNNTTRVFDDLSHFLVLSKWSTKLFPTIILPIIQTCLSHDNYKEVYIIYVRGDEKTYSQTH